MRPTTRSIPSAARRPLADLAAGAARIFGLEPGETPPAILAILVVAAVALLLSVLDRNVEGPRLDFLRVVVVGWAVWDAATLVRSRRDPDSARRLRSGAILVAAGLGAVALAGAIASASPDAAAKGLKLLLETRAFLMLAALCWHLSPVVLEWRERRAGPRDPGVAICLALAVFALVAAASSVASANPKDSFRTFNQDVGPWTSLLVLLYRTLRAAPAASEGLLRAWAWTCWGAVVAGLLVVLAFRATSFSPSAYEFFTKAEFGKATLIQLEPWPPDEWRLNFPFGHHNRMSFFSAMAVLVLAMTRATPGLAPRSRRALAAGMLVAGLDLLATLGRGAWLSLGGAAGGMAVLRLRGRRLLAVLAGGFVAIALLLALLPDQRSRLFSLLDPRTYTEERSTVSLRVRHWRAAGRMIRENPVLGIGYGWKTFEQEYARLVAEEPTAPVEVVHAHNLWLQVTAETGFVGLLAFLAFQALRWLWMARTWLRRDRLATFDATRLLYWIGIELVFQIYSLSNLALRRSLGLILVIQWAILLADLARMERSLSRPESSDPNELPEASR